MKAQLDVNGVLTVSAENGTEAFALACWHARFKPDAENTTVLYIKSDIGEPVISQPRLERRDLPDPPPGR